MVVCVDACSRSAESSRNVRRTSGVKPVTKATQCVSSGRTIFYGTVVSRGKRSFDVALEFTDALSFSLSNLSGTNAVNGLLEVGNFVVTAELLNVVAEAGAASELVSESSNVFTFADTSSCRSSKAIDSSLNVCSVGFLLVKRRKDWSFFS